MQEDFNLMKQQLGDVQQNELESRKHNRPLLNEVELIDIYNKLHRSLQLKNSVTIIIYDSEYNRGVNGTVTQIEEISRRVKIQCQKMDEWILMNDIIKVIRE